MADYKRYWTQISIAFFVGTFAGALLKSGFCPYSLTSAASSNGDAGPSSPDLISKSQTIASNRRVINMGADSTEKESVNSEETAVVPLRYLSATSTPALSYNLDVQDSFCEIAGIDDSQRQKLAEAINEIRGNIRSQEADNLKILENKKDKSSYFMIKPYDASILKEKFYDKLGRILSKSQFTLFNHLSAYQMNLVTGNFGENARVFRVTHRDSATIDSGMPKYSVEILVANSDDPIDLITSGDELFDVLNSTAKARAADSFDDVPERYQHLIDP